MRRVSIEDIRSRKVNGAKLTMLTAYDCPMAKLLDEAGVDIILVGDSLGMVVLGYESTTSVTMEEMLHHARAARRGTARALLVGDMPFLSFRGSIEESVKNAGRFIQESGCDAVKIEWKRGVEAIAHAIVDAGIPVIGHVGLTPQTALADGGFGMRGKDAESAARIIAQAIALQEAGCFAMVLECVPDQVAREITGRLRVPTIGIGSGPWCDGQVLVTHDLIGLFEGFKPRFVKRYAETAKAARRAVKSYIEDVRSGAFPGREQTVVMDPQELSKLTEALGEPH